MSLKHSPSESSSQSTVNVKTDITHHIQQELCTTRPVYRQGRKLTAVKVYTINQESQHLYLYGVPSLNLRVELKRLCSKYGHVLSIHVVADAVNEPFTECFHVQYQRIQSSRIAKRLLDAKSFYGGILHVCYTPENETMQETKAKLLQRKRDILNRLPKEELNITEKTRAKVKGEEIERQKAKKKYID